MKTLKKLTSLILWVVLLLSLFPSLSYEAKAAKVTYAVEGGALYFDPDTGAVTDCDINVTCANIPAQINGVAVTTIGDSAFKDCTKLTSVAIPDSVTSIGSSAFYGCMGLTNVTIGNSVTTIGNYAFYRCTGLTSVTIGNSVTTIYSFAFYGCTELTSVTIPDSVTSIGYFAFYGCTGLTSVTIPDSVTSIGSSAFKGCTSLTSVTIPDSVTSIGSNAFYNTGYYNDGNNWDGDILYIGNHFIKAKTTISGAYTIRDNTLTIADDAFYGCTGLTSVTIPDSVTSIGSYAFYNCTSLTSVTIPDSVTSIGYSAFEGCTKLTSVTIPDSVTSIGYSAFEGCTGLTSVTIGNSVTSIGGSAFYGCTKLTSVTIPDSVTSIGSYAFYNCTSLTSVTIPDSVTSIGSNAFYNTGYYRDSSNWDGDVLYIGNHFIQAKTAISGAYTIRDNTLTIAGSAFYGCTGLTSVTIPDSVTSIGNYAFEDCTKLTSVTIPDSVTSIGSSAFEGCTGLKSVTIPDSVTSIGDSAFRGCTGLKSVTIPDSVTSIGDYAFYNTGLTDVYYTGAEEMWHTIKIQPYNDPLLNAEIHFNCCPHKTAVFQEGFDATCTENGRIPHYICTDCGKYFKDAACTKEITGSVIIEACHSYELVESIPAECEWTGGNYYTCTVCGHNKTEILPATGHSFDVGTVTTAATCTEPGVLTYTCSRCSFAETEAIPPKGHRYIRYSNSGLEHSVRCAYCESQYTEAHVFTSGDCICGAKESDMPTVVELPILHSLNLASDIAISYVIPAESLAEYDSYYMECTVPKYEGNALVDTTKLVLEGEQRGEYYYFVLNGMISIEMNNMVQAQLFMTKDGSSYVSAVDRYSIATYAYNQLNGANRPEALKAVCANLLQYGAKAQLWKGYRTDALADASMTEEHRSYLTDPESVVFGQNKQSLKDLEDPQVSFVGIALRLDSKVVVRFVVDTTAFRGESENLNLRITYTDIDGKEKTVTLADLEVYYAASNYYAFNFDGLLAAELRTMMSVAVYDGDTRVSETMTYSPDSYGNGKTGTVLTLMQAMIAYSDSARQYFLT